jgi:hypothetical protein
MAAVEGSGCCIRIVHVLFETFLLKKAYLRVYGYSALHRKGVAPTSPPIVILLPFLAAGRTHLFSFGSLDRFLEIRAFKIGLK